MNYKQLNILLLTFILSGCALYQPKYNAPFNNNFTKVDGKIEKSFYLIGDAGYANKGLSTPALLALEKYLETNKEKGNYTIFLGDNIYPAGMPKKGDKLRHISQHRLDVQINAVKNFDGQVYFIPGNHDWYNKGLQGLKRQEQYLEGKLGDKKLFQPTGGCALKSIDVSSNIQLLILDSQWYLEDWDNNPTINDECPQLRTREAMFQEIEGEFKKNQNKTIVFALHHPLYTNGTHGGQYAPVKHIFPSQKKLPLPILGSLAMQIRTSGGISIQDKQNKQYQSLVKRLETLAKGAERIIFTSGHEHSLQYIEHEGIRQIVSGAGAKNSFATLSNDGLFAYGGQGFVRLDIYDNGSSWASFYGVENNAPKLLFKKEVYKKFLDYDVSQLKPTQQKTVKASVYKTEFTNKSELYESIWGDHYRNLYGKKINAKVAILDTLYGGLEVVRRGGGHQTRSLRLKTKDGKEYNMRALKKSGVKFLQSTVFKKNYVEDALEDTVSEEILKDFYTSAHPYVFTTIPKLSHAVGVFHTNPKLYYIPKQKALGPYNVDHGDQLYLIEERPEKHHINLTSFGKPDDIESTADVYERLRRDEKYKIDEPTYIRARLFDMLIGDWDRHQDQWRWAEYKLENGDHVFKPIPRDRDQAFANFDGAFLASLRGLIGSAKMFQVYDTDLKDIKWINASAVRLDRTLLKNSVKKDWLHQAKYIQEHLTNKSIEEAFATIPLEARGEDLNNIKTKLRGRLGNLLDIASRYYDYVSELVVITGTDKDDHFEIERLPQGKTKIVITRIKGGDKADVILNRVFNKKHTKQIRLYGLDDDDVFEAFGKGNHPIKIRLIGGQNNDVYKIKNGKNIIIYDHKSKPNTIKNRGGARVSFTDKYNVNHFNKEGKEMNSTSIIPNIGFNPDDGVWVGPTINLTFEDFNKNPFTTSHLISGRFYFATQGFDFNYRGEFAGVFENYNLLLSAKYTSPNYAVNFFGLGNETSNFDNQSGIGLDFNRVKLSTYRFAIGASKRGRFGSNFEYKAMVEGIQVDRTPGRFIDTFSNNSVFFQRNYFLGLDVTYSYESYDVNVNPTRGMKFLINAGSRSNLDKFKRTYGYINSHLSFYNALSNSRKWVLKTAVEHQINIGSQYEFYQSAQIGGHNLMRGYRNQRFSGQTSLATSADVRYSFKPFKTRFLPLQLGVFAGGDLGRVWQRGDDKSSKWHNDLGGGFWVNSADAIGGTFNLFTGADGPRFSFGFLFKL